VRADISAETPPAGRSIRRWTVAPLIALIRVYQFCLSPWLGMHCRFTPTCSQYAIEALAQRGIVRGSWLAVRRILRCRPGGGSGYDPVTGTHHHQEPPK
jgi:hypothetical protein